MLLPRILAGAGVFLIAAAGRSQYRPLVPPPEWTFTRPVPAFDPGAPDKRLGEFRPGIRVEVLQEDPRADKWRVVFQRLGAPDIEALVPAPDLSRDLGGMAPEVADVVAGFPLLRRMLESPGPWSGGLRQTAALAFGESAEVVVGSGDDENPGLLVAAEPAAIDAWGLHPLKASVRAAPASPAVILEFWNKGDAYRSPLDPARARETLREKLRVIQAAFRPPLDDPGPGSATLNALGSREEAFLLPNDLRVAIQYDSGEFLLLEIESLSALQAARPVPFDRDTLAATLRKRVATHPEGHRFISGVPMIDQGDKGYCAAATLARVLNHYGFPVDQHEIARLAETEAQLTGNSRGGTRRDKLLDAMRRVCAGTPFRLRPLDTREPAEILAVIEKGTPVLWFVPGHVRLLIGIHPDNNEVVYSDSYGPGHEFSIASWDDFYNTTVEMWTLDLKR